MNYKIISITDKQDNPKTTPEVLDRIGRIVTFNTPMTGKSLFMECIIPGFFKSLITSPVRNVITDGETVVIITNNSKYYLERYNDE